MSKKCLVKGCKNHSNQGEFRGPLCLRCHQMLLTGEVHPRNPTFIGYLSRKQAEAQVTATKQLMTRLYNTAYAAGHEDTVEGRYVDVVPADMDDYHADVVEQWLSEGAPMETNKSKNPDPMIFSRACKKAGIALDINNMLLYKTETNSLNKGISPVRALQKALEEELT